MRSVVDRSVVMRLMTVHNHITKTMILEYNSYVLQVAINNTVTIQNNERHNDTQHNLLQTAFRRCHHTTLGTQSGPVYLSSPPQYRQLSVLLSSRYGQGKVCHVLFITRWPQMAVVKCF